MIKPLGFRIARVAAVATAAMLLMCGAGPVGAATIVQPTGTPSVVANAPLAVVATGFKAGTSVFIEQCDGVAPSTPNWSPTINCDLGSSPPAAIADAQGQASFTSRDVNRAFLPFEGESPQSLFNCMSAHRAPPENSLPSFTNCKVRVSSNNSTATPDQVFFPIVLSGQSVPPPTVATTTTTAPGRKEATTSTVPAQPKPGVGKSAATTTTSVSKTKNVTTESGGDNGATASAAVATLHAPSSKSSGGVGLFGVSDHGLGLGYLLVLGGLLIALGPVFVRRRRARRV